MQAAAQAKLEAQQILAAVEPNASPMKKRFAGSKPGTLDCKTTRTIPSFDSQEVRDPLLSSWVDLLPLTLAVSPAATSRTCAACWIILMAEVCPAEASIRSGAVNHAHAPVCLRTSEACVSCSELPQPPVCATCVLTRSQINRAVHCEYAAWLKRLITGMRLLTELS